jgi:hypothetical protein
MWKVRAVTSLTSSVIEQIRESFVIMTFYAIRWSGVSILGRFTVMLMRFTVVVWQTMTAPSSVKVETETKVFLPYQSYLWMMDERFMVGMPTEVVDQKISISSLHLNHSVDAASISNLSRYTLRLEGDLKLYLPKKPQAFQSFCCGNAEASLNVWRS